MSGPETEPNGAAPASTSIPLSAQLNNLILKLSELKALEKEANTRAANDDCTAGEIRKSQLAIQYKTGRFETDFKAFMDECGIRPGTHLLEICQTFFQKGKRDLSL